MDRVLNARIRKLCGMAKGVDERIEEDVFHWFSHVESMENDRIAKRLYVGEFAGSTSAGQPQKKRWIDTMKDLKKKKKFGWQARRIVHDRSEWWGV